MKKATQHNIGLKELRRNTENYIRGVKKGNSFVVFRRSEPVFKLSSPYEEELWETVVDFTEINKEGVSARDVLDTLSRMHGAN